MQSNQVVSQAASGYTGCRHDASHIHSLFYRFFPFPCPPRPRVSPLLPLVLTSPFFPLPLSPPYTLFFSCLSFPSSQVCPIRCRYLSWIASAAGAASLPVIYWRPDSGAKRSMAHSHRLCRRSKTASQHRKPAKQWEPRGPGAGVLEREGLGVAGKGGAEKPT